MSREIKFRVWDKKQKCMCNPEITFSQNRLALDLRGYPFFKDNQGCDDRGYVEETFEWMQYIGLKDKDGKEIYEGDIVRKFNRTFESDVSKYDMHPERWVFIILHHNLTWCIQGAKMELHHPDDMVSKPIVGDDEFEYFDETDFDMKIIGNIYENPEMIE